MRTMTPYLLILVLILAPSTGWTNEQKETEADQAAGKWLALVDGRQYSESWDRAAPVFQQQISRADWRHALGVARKPMGDMTSRKLISASFTTSLPGAPEGEYVVLQYETSFEFRQYSVETVTPMLVEGRWLVSGYYVR